MKYKISPQFIRTKKRVGRRNKEFIEIMEKFEKYLDDCVNLHTISIPYKCGPVQRIKDYYKIDVDHGKGLRVIIEQYDQEYTLFNCYSSHDDYERAIKHL